VTTEFDGDLFKRGESGYEKARPEAVWNGRKPDRLPDMILLAESEQDVVSAVRMAADRGLSYKAEELLDWWLPRLPHDHDRFNTGVFAYQSHAPGSDDKLMNITQMSFGTSEAESLKIMKSPGSMPLTDRVVMGAPPAKANLDDAYDFMDEIYPEDLRYFADAIWVDHAKEGLSATLQAIFLSLPTRWSHVLLGPWKPREHKNHAFSQQSFLSVHIYGACDEPEDDEATAAWMRATMELLKPYEVAGGKIDDADLVLRDHRVLSEENTARLGELRAEHDPSGIFHSYLRSGA
jgi:hypothetical protein